MENLEKIPIIIKGIWYHPIKFIPPKIPGPFEKFLKLEFVINLMVKLYKNVF